MTAKNLKQRLGFVLSLSLALIAGPPALSAADVQGQMQQDIKGESTNQDHKDGVHASSLLRGGGGDNKKGGRYLSMPLKSSDNPGGWTDGTQNGRDAGDKGTGKGKTEPVEKVDLNFGHTSTSYDTKSGDGKGKGKTDPVETIQLNFGHVSTSYSRSGDAGGKGPHGSSVSGALDDIPLDDSSSMTTFGGAQGAHGHHVTVDGKPGFAGGQFTGPVTSPVQPQQPGGPMFDRTAIQSLQQQLQNANNTFGNNPGTTGGAPAATASVRQVGSLNKLDIGRAGSLSVPSISGGNAFTGGVKTGVISPAIGGAISGIGGQSQPAAPVGVVHGGAVIQPLGGGLTTSGATVGGAHLGGRANLLPAVQQINLTGH